MYKTPFLNRQTAGRELGRALKPRIEGGAAVFGISDGGMAVAAETARYLDAALYPLSVHKLRIPGHDNLSMGALAPQGVHWLDHNLIDRLGITEAALRKVLHKEMLELRQSESMQPAGDVFGRIGGRTAVIMDDGISNNSHSILAAIEFVRKQGPQKLLVAAPVIASGAVAELADKCEGLICLCQPEIFVAADYWFEQPTQKSSVQQ